MGGLIFQETGGDFLSEDRMDLSYDLGGFGGEHSAFAFTEPAIHRFADFFCRKHPWILRLYSETKLFIVKTPWQMQYSMISLALGCMPCLVRLLNENYLVIKFKLCWRVRLVLPCYCIISKLPETQIPLTLITKIVVLHHDLSWGEIRTIRSTQRFITIGALSIPDPPLKFWPFFFAKDHLCSALEMWKSLSNFNGCIFKF